MLFSASRIAEGNFSNGLNVSAKKDRVEDMKMTNREWLANMSNKELAGFLDDVETSASVTAWECWLEAEREEDKK